MGLRNSSLLCLALFLAFSSSIQCLDITKLLGKYPEFAKFSQYLTETKLAEQINGQKAVTVLALDDSALASFSGKSPDAVKAALSSQVVVGFYDEQKLMMAQGSHEKLTTLSSATAIFVDLIGEGEVAFAPSVQGAKYSTKLVRTVTTEPGTVSLLQVSEAIVAPSAAASSSSSSSSSPPPSSSSSSPSKPPSSSSSSPATPPSPAAHAKAPAAPAKAPAKEPVAEAKAPVAETKPAAASSSSSSSETKASAPAPSSGSRAQVGLVGGAAVALVSLFVSL